jgi:hypothetical protein
MTRTKEPVVTMAMSVRAESISSIAVDSVIRSFAHFVWANILDSPGGQLRAGEGGGLGVLRGLAAWCGL